jgi:glycosyltransferase involved in cell wall biosynthesis
MAIDMKAAVLSPPPSLEEVGRRLAESATGTLWRQTPGLNESATQPLVSVVTVCRNAAATIERTLVSVLGQGYSPIEYIVVDGGSTDGTLAIVERYRTQIACCMSEPDEGISDAFNKGIALASGQLVALLNADDWYEPDCVERIVERYRQASSGIFHGRIYHWLSTGEVQLVEGSDEKLHLYSTVNHPTTFVSRDVYERIGLFRKDFRYAMDYEWMLRAKRQGIPFVYLDAGLANMDRRGISTRAWRGALREAKLAQDLHCPGLARDVQYLFDVVKGSLREVLLQVGLRPLVYFYQNKLALQQRTLIQPPRG